MAEERKLELHLLRFLPHALRDDFVTVGFVLLEGDGGFAEVRFTRDWRMLQCVAPDVDLEWFTAVENEIRGRIKSVGSREDLVQLMSGRFGAAMDVAPTKAVVTRDPLRELEELSGIYLVAPARGERTQPRTGRAAIVHAMSDAFSSAQVLDLMLQDIDVGQYTGAGDPFRIDFGYRRDGEMKMFHAVSVAANADQALALAYRYSRIEAGMKKERMRPSLTAVIDESAAANAEKVNFALGMLWENAIRTRPVAEVREMAAEIRSELMP